MSARAWLAVVVLAIAACNPREFAREHGGITRLSIATGNTGGVYYPYGGGLAKVISQSLPRVDATAEVTAASVDNLKLIQLGKVDIAFTFADTLDDAVRGRGAFEKTGAVKARTLAMLYPNYTHLATLEGNDIKRLADLRGKVVSTGSPGSGTEVIAFRLLQAAGLDPDRDIRRQALSVNAAVDAIKDGKIDAFFWSGGMPTASLLDLASTMGITAKLLAERRRASGAAGGLRAVALLPAGDAEGVRIRASRSDIGVVAVAKLLVVDGAWTRACLRPDAGALRQKSRPRRDSSRSAPT